MCPAIQDFISNATVFSSVFLLLLEDAFWSAGLKKTQKRGDIASLCWNKNRIQTQQLLVENRINPEVVLYPMIAHQMWNVVLGLSGFFLSGVIQCTQHKYLSGRWRWTSKSDRYILWYRFIEKGLILKGDPRDEMWASKHSVIYHLKQLFPVNSSLMNY